MKIVLFGPPGAGKGTNAGFVAQKTGAVHISTGDMFRENLKKETPLGKKAKGYMDKGLLVPDDVVIDMVQERISRADAKNNFLLDGFPRTIPQADALNKMCGGVELVLHLTVPRDVIIQRLSGRILCKDCGEVYHKTNMPPKVDGVCDKCGGKRIYQRDDDKPEAIRKRLDVYDSETKALLDYYQKAGVLKTVDKVERQETQDAIAAILAAF